MNNVKRFFFLVIIPLIFAIIFFWESIKNKYFFLAYKENCLISLSSTNSKINLNSAKLICSCISDKIKLNNDKLVTSKLHVERKVKDNKGKFLPIDEILYRPNCIKLIKNKYADQ